MYKASLTNSKQVVVVVVVCYFIYDQNKTETIKLINNDGQ